MIMSLSHLLLLSGAGPCDGWRRRALRPAPLHHRPERSRNQKDDGGLRGTYCRFDTEVDIQNRCRSNLTGSAQVNIWVPQAEQQSDVIKVMGQEVSVERAKQALMCRVKELQAEQEERVKGAQHTVMQSTCSITNTAEITRCKTSHEGHYTPSQRQRASTSSCCLTNAPQTPLGIRKKHNIIEMVLIRYPWQISAKNWIWIGYFVPILFISNEEFVFICLNLYSTILGCDILNMLTLKYLWSF